MQVQRLPKSYFDRFSEKPVAIKPFDPHSKKQAMLYRAELNEVLAPYNIKAELHGSVELEVAGKGEWEFAIYLDGGGWYPVLKRLINHFGTIYELTDDFALFEDRQGEMEIEVIPMRGETAIQNQAIMAYWHSHPDACKEYERLKYQHAHSKRAYYWWKSNLIADILESLQTT